MALPQSGIISIKDIKTELNVLDNLSFSIYNSEIGIYVPINQISSPRPNFMAPSSMSEWYGYNHGASLGCGWDRRVVYLTWRQMIIVDLGTQSGLVDISITTSDTNTDPVRFYVLYPTTDVWSNAQLLSGMYFNTNNTLTYYYNYNPSP